MVTPEFLELLVAEKADEAPNICSVRLVSPAGLDLPAFEPGAHVDIHLPNGFIRQYSLCGDARNRREYWLGVLRDPASRGGSISFHDDLKAGDSVRISVPRNHFQLIEGADNSLLFAGGIGVTPILSMARRLAELGRRFTVHYCARSRTAAAFLEVLAQPELLPNVKLHFDDEEPSQRLDIEAVVRAADPETHFYVCGPTGFMDWILATIRDAGIMASYVHREYFTNTTALLSGDAFTVVLRRSNLSFQIPPDHSILEVLRSNGIDLDVSCEQGVCGTCLTPVLEGTPDHRDMYLSDAEHSRNDVMTPCCSRSKSDVLVLDL